MLDAERLRLEARMDNWARWSSSGQAFQVNRTCASAERHYVPPRDPDGARLDRSAREPVNALEAEETERALVRMSDQKARKYLVAVYYYRNDCYFLQRKFRVELKLQEGFRWRALELLSSALTMKPVVLIRRGKPLWAGIDR